MFIWHSWGSSFRRDTPSMLGPNDRSSSLPSPAPTSIRRSSGRPCWVPRSFEFADAGASRYSRSITSPPSLNGVLTPQACLPSLNRMQLIRRLSPYVLGAPESSARLLGGAQRNAFEPLTIHRCEFGVPHFPSPPKVPTHPSLNSGTRPSPHSARPAIGRG
jgi:hypothetical protein